VYRHGAAREFGGDDESTKSTDAASGSRGRHHPSRRPLASDRRQSETCGMRTFTVVDALDLAAAYAAARYGVRVDVAPLSLRVGERATELERQWPAQSYMFITAWNPASNPRPDDANHAADALLTARLDELGI